MDITKEQRDDLLSMFSTDIVKFSEYVCSDVVRGEVPEFHRQMYEMALSSERVLIAAPRGFSKSTILARIYPLWLAVFGLRTDILMISASEGLAIENLRYVKLAVETNPVLRAFFGDMTSDKWRENHIELSLPDGRRVQLRAKGAGGQIRGFRPDCLILDDLETDDSVESEDQRKKLKDWVFKACINCLLPGGQLVVIGTILSQLSLLNDLLSSPNGWDKVRYKAYIDGVEDEAHALWPKARPHAWLQVRKKEIGTTRFSAEFMNDPLSDENAPIKEENIRTWGDVSSGADRALPKGLNMVIAVDPAYSEEDSADFKVAGLVGCDADANRYLIRYSRTHAPVGDYINDILNLWQANRDYVTAVGIPSKGIEKEFFRSLVNQATDRKMFPPFVELGNTFMTASGGTVRSKKQRIIAALEPLFQQGKYFIGVNHFEARDELLTIGNSRWDDLVDMMAYAEQIITPQYFENDSSRRDDYKDDVSVSLALSSGSYGIEY